MEIETELLDSLLVFVPGEQTGMGDERSQNLMQSVSVVADAEPRES